MSRQDQHLLLKPIPLHPKPTRLQWKHINPSSCLWTNDIPVFHCKNTFLSAPQSYRLVLLMYRNSFSSGLTHIHQIFLEAAVREDEMCWTSSKTTYKLLILVGFKRSDSAMVGIAAWEQALASALRDHTSCLNRGYPRSLTYLVPEV